VRFVNSSCDLFQHSLAFGSDVCYAGVDTLIIGTKGSLRTTLSPNILTLWDKEFMCDNTVRSHDNIVRSRDNIVCSRDNITVTIHTLRSSRDNIIVTTLTLCSSRDAFARLREVKL
jgi:hypothetical protein